MKRIGQILTIAALLGAVTSCKSHTFTVQPPGPASAVDPEIPECIDADAGSLIADHMDDLQACTEFLGCRTNHIRTLTLMLGCNGEQGALYVLSHKELEKYNQCMVEKGEGWDFSQYCTGEESECAWTFPVDIECKVE